MHSTVNKWSEDRKWFIERSVVTLKVCLSFFNGCRKDEYVLCSKLNLLAQQGEPLPEGFQPSVAIASTLNFTIALVLFHLIMSLN